MDPARTLTANIDHDIRGFFNKFLVYCAECWTDRGEDIYNPVEHHYAIDLLGLQGRTLHLGTRHKPDLDLLRYAA
jgi:hypothetical protein